MPQNAGNTPLHSINLIGFDDIETRKFSAVLDLAAFGLNQEWQITDLPDADLTINKKPSSKLSARQRKASFYRYSLRGGQSKPEHTIRHDRAYIPLIHDLIDKLNDAKILAKTNTAYSPSAWLKTIIEADECLHINIESQQFYIDPIHESFYCDTPLETLKPLLSSDEAPTIETITPADLNKRIQQAGLSKHPLKHLIWYAAFTSSNGLLIETLSETDIIQLTDWPYLGAESREYIKLATYLKHKQSSLSDAASETEIKTEIANDFYNASYLARIIKKHPFVTTNTHTKPVENLSFLEKIKDRLRR